MDILVVNDDGFDSIGIRILAKKLKKYGNVTIIAPNSCRSASSHAIEVRNPITVKKEANYEGIEVYSQSGYPADSVRISDTICNKKFDICFSGVNDGLNLGTDIFYSGTSASAREANIEKMYSVAISCDKNSFDIVEKELDMVLEYIFNNNLFSYLYTLNINFPIGKYNKSKGIKFAHQDYKLFKTGFLKIDDNSYIEHGHYIEEDINNESDVYLANEGYITIVPISLDQTNYDSLDKLKNKFN